MLIPKTSASTKRIGGWDTAIPKAGTSKTN
jgi:hypothetical protein